MKISDLLRDFADAHLLRGIADAVDKEVEAPSEESEENIDNPDDVFIPPLQQNIEMMKKSSGVENVYDQDKDDDEPSERHSYPDPLNQIRQSAGLVKRLNGDNLPGN